MSSRAFMAPLPSRTQHTEWIAGEAMRAKPDLPRDAGQRAHEPKTVSLFSSVGDVLLPST